ncbi:hypothetical protein ACLQ22_00100 [Micromonospora sp. DT178]|uniref:hypothetical protein n=1 Tax=Micromonospora sp. DT178 TaxID=3393436 RepID=UPI003CF08E5B
MPHVASLDPFWSVTLRSLRELTRLAIAALVLAVGLGGASAAPAPSAGAPAAVTVPAAVTAAAPTVAGARLTPPLSRREPTAEQVDGFAAPPAVRRDDTPADTSAVAVARQDGPARDPGRGVPARRGPPAA